MTRIKILDKATVNKIAAGEVIERPASVVKELVENSIDAGASDIRIVVSGAGRDSIEVIDDGSGISADSVKLAFEQHATSKIGVIDDLDSLATMGFRGEALSSIAAVAVVEMWTKVEGAETGIHVRLEGGRVVEQEECARTTGTTIRVTGLFRELPARLKYLKSDRVEMSHVIEAVTERALANPGIGFRLHNQDIEVFNYPRGELKDRMTDVYGRKVAKELVGFGESDKGVEIRGYVAGPGISRSTTKDLRIFVNSRPVASRQVVDAVERGFAGLLMRNRHPVGVIRIEIDPRELDVNVHPTKREVRFADVNRVSRLVTRTIASVLGNVDIIRSVEPKTVKTVVKEPGKAKATATEGLQKKLVEEEEGADIDESRMLPRMRLIGQMLDTYILAQSGTDLIIIDQHAAHERVMLDRLKRASSKGRVEQRLITPIPLRLGPKERELLEHYMRVIEELGFKIEPFGSDTYLVRAVPVTGGSLETEEGLRDLIQELAEWGRARSIDEKKDELMHLVACHSAIRAGERLSQEQMARLVGEMHGADIPYACAHGRPTLVRITRKELERLFKRTV